MTELQADRDSDRRIAERLGLSVKYRGTMQHPIPFIDDGNAFGPELPRYTTDLNAAIVLLRYHCRAIPIAINYGGVDWVCTLDHIDENPIHGRADEPALAVCRAWWAWMDGRE